MDKQIRIWDGVFGSFAEAGGEDTVFEGDVWLNKINARARGAGVLGERVCNSACRRDSRLRAAVCGGAGGAARSGLENSRLRRRYGDELFAAGWDAPPGQLLEYVIVENNAVCRGGGELMANDRRLHFRTDLPPPGERYDILHCGSSLHYIDDWQEMLVRFAALEPAFMLFADLPAADNRSFVTQQMFHDRRIPVHFGISVSLFRACRSSVTS